MLWKKIILKCTAYAIGQLFVNSNFKNCFWFYRSLSYLSGLLEKNDRSVRIAAGEALAAVFEMCSFEKFSAEAKGSSHGSNHDKSLLHIQGLRGKIINQVRELSMEAGGKGSVKKDLNRQRNLFRDILEFMEVALFIFPSVQYMHCFCQCVW